jgi:hypothetical protein
MRRRTIRDIRGPQGRSDGLELFQSRPVDAVLTQYRLCISEGSAVADQIKHARPELPLGMLVEHLELPADALRSGDPLVAKSDAIAPCGATIHFLLNLRPAQRQENRELER